MKYEYKELPIFVMNKDHIFEIVGYVKKLVSIPETEEEQEAMEE